MCWFSIGVSSLSRDDCVTLTCATSKLENDFYSVTGSYSIHTYEDIRNISSRSHWWDVIRSSNLPRRVPDVMHGSSRQQQ